MTKRRKFLAGATAGVAAAITTSPSIAQGQHMKLRMATCWPSTYSGLTDSPERFAKRVHAMSGGAITIEVLHADQSKVPVLQLLETVAKGQLDLSHETPYYWTKFSPGFNFFATVPMGMMAAEHYAWLRFGGGMEFWEKLAGQHGVVPLPCGNTGVQMGGWFRQKITSLDSLRGLKMRWPGLGGEVYRRMGAEPMLIPIPDIKNALRDGKLDAAELVTPWNDLALGIQDVCRYYYYPGIHEPGHTTELLVNPKVWSRLSPAQQEMFRTAAWLEASEMLGQFSFENARHLSDMHKIKTIEVLRLPNDVTREFRKHTPDVLRAAAEADPLSKQVYQSYMGFLQQQLRWHELADRAYWQARYV